MKISKKNALELIDEKISLFGKILDGVSYENRHYEDFNFVRQSTESLLTELFPNEFLASFRRPLHVVTEGLKGQKDHINRCITRLRVYRERVQNFWPDGQLEPPKSGKVVSDSIADVLHICKRFHVVAGQLRKRHNNRPTLEIKDEYDVQDLLHSLLKIHFDDVRKEEWTPSYAGGTSRMDFLIKKEKIVVEVKKTRENLADKEIGEQLLIDVAKYKLHPDCKTLICFVYDPEGRIGNPKGLENDLDQLSNEDMNVISIVAPS